MTTGDWSAGLDCAVPGLARITNYLLGGALNFAADRDAGDRLLAAIPDARRRAITNRAFLARAVRYLLGQGVRQFLDVGSGFAAIGAVHEITAPCPEARVAYVDPDPVVVAHAIDTVARANPRVTALRAHLGAPSAILTDHNIRTLFDLDEPVGVVMTGVLPFVADTDAYPGVAGLLTALAPSSHLALSHPVGDVLDPDRRERMVEVYRRCGREYVPRDRAEIARFLEGLTVLDPGLVTAGDWRPDPGGRPGEQRDALLVAVARKPA